VAWPVGWSASFGYSNLEYPLFPCFYWSGLKSADSLWTRLVLDLNRARDVVTHTIGQIRELVAGFRAICSGACS